MNVRHISIFTICVVLPNGLYSTDKYGEDTEINSQSVIDYWLSKNLNNTKSPIQEDKEGNLIIKLAAKIGKHRCPIFVLRVRKIGINLIVTTRVAEVSANNRLIDYFAKVLEVPKSSLEVVAGLNSKWKTLILRHGFLSMKTALMKLVVECVEPPP